MFKVYPRMMVFPSIFLLAFSLLILSFSINSSTVEGIKIRVNQNPINLEKPVLKDHLSGKYPQSIQKWREEIEHSANKYALDPNLIAAIMLQESGGQSSIISTSGAVGLMQIMPKDGIASGFICGDNPCFKNRPSINELLNPDYNIDFGAHLLSELLKTSGSTRNALKSYGPMDMGFHYADIILSIYLLYK